jgi:hypothetical protein
MNQNNGTAFPGDLNPALVGAIATFIGRLTGLTPPPTDAFPPEWQGHLRELVQSIDAEWLKKADAARAEGFASDDDTAHLLSSPANAERLKRSIAELEAELGPGYQAGLEALELAQKWEKLGVIVTIERMPHKPLAMGHHYPQVKTWPKRGSAE